MSPRPVDRAARRRDVLDAAVRVFARRGYAAATVDEIAREAGVAKGTVYLYADGRAELLAAAFAEFEEAMLAAARAAVTTDAPALARLAGLVHAVLGTVDEAPALARVVVDFWASSVAARDDAAIDTAIDMDRVYGRYRALVAELLAAAAAEGDLRPDLPPDVSTAVVGTLEGVVLQWIMNPSAVPLSTLAATTTTLLLDGLRPRPES